MEYNNITMTANPYDVSKDLLKNITCTNESINATYIYNKDKDLNVVGNNSPHMLVENEQGIFWICPKCQELNEVTKSQCTRCYYVQTVPL